MNKIYPIAGIFYSLQGEGLYTGKPMLFLRLAGCNLKCKFCDTDYSRKESLSKEEILTKLRSLSTICHTVLITGGEPNIHDLVELSTYFHRHNYQLHMETNGEPTKYLVDNLEEMDFITVSPKTKNVSPEALNRAGQIKYLVGPLGWKKFIQTTEDFLICQAARYISPVFEFNNTVLPSTIEKAINFCKTNPEFSLTLQTHKLISIP